MRIGIDISQIVYQTGVSRYTAKLVEHLLRIDKTNDYVLYAGSLRQRKIIKSYVSGLPRKVKLVLTPLAPKLADTVLNRFNLPLAAWLGKLDVFHASNWILPNLNCPIVTTIHDLTFLKFPEEHLPYYISAHKRHLSRAKTKAAAVIAVSQSTKTDLVGIGFNGAKIKVVYEAADSTFRPDKAKEVLRKYQLNKPYILSVGTLEPRKNINRLIEAFGTLRQKNLKLAIVGKFGWGDRTKPVPGVRLLGFVPDEDLAGLYSGAKAFVYPSLYEGFGLPVVEALACGCPVVTSNISSLPEVAGKAAVYVDPKSVESIAEGITKAFKQGDVLRRAGLTQAKNFSWDKTAKETLTLYREVYAHRD